MASTLCNTLEKTILIFEWVTGGGLVGQILPRSLATEGTAIRRAVVADFAAVPGVRVLEPVDARCADLAPELARVSRIIADPDHPIDLEACVGLVDQVVLIAPETDGILAGLARRVAAVEAASLGSSAAAIELCANKLRLADHLGRAAIPTPPTRAFRPADGWPQVGSDSGQVVIKPLDGAGSVDTFVCDEDAAVPISFEGDIALVQPFRSGAVGSASFLVGPDGSTWLLGVGRQRIRIGAAGRVTYQGGKIPVPIAATNLASIRSAIESVPGLRGFVGVDFVFHPTPDQVEILEINPRLTTSIVGLVQLATPGTIARAWLSLFEAGADFDKNEELAKIATMPPVQFAPDGSIGPSAEDHP